MTEFEYTVQEMSIGPQVGRRTACLLVLVATGLTIAACKGRGSGESAGGGSEVVPVQPAESTLGVESKVNLREAFVRNPQDYPEPVEPLEGSLSYGVDNETGEKLVKVEPNSNISIEARNTSLQNSLDWIAANREEMGIDKIVLASGIHNLDGAPVVLDERHSGIKIEGEIGAVIDARKLSGAIFIDGAKRGEESVRVSISNLTVRNGDASARTQMTNIARTDGKRYTLWSNLDGGGIVAIGGAEVHIDDCRFEDCRSFTCGGTLFFDIAEGVKDPSTVTNCTFDGSDIVETGLGTGFAIDVMSGNVRIQSCIFRNCGGPNKRTDNGVVSVFSNAYVIISNCLFDMSRGLQTAIAYAGGDKGLGVLVVGEGNQILGVSENDIQIVRVLRRIEQPKPTEEEARIMEEVYGFVWVPQEANWANNIRDKNPGIDGAGAGWLGKRNVLDRMGAMFDGVVFRGVERFIPSELEGMTRREKNERLHIYVSNKGIKYSGGFICCN